MRGLEVIQRRWCSSPVLGSFQIANFKIFRALDVPHLGAVNLVVGKNNTGKTLLLEALRFYKAGGSRLEISRLLRERDEVVRGLGERWSENFREELLDVAALFHGRPTDLTNQELTLTAGDSPTLKLAVGHEMSEDPDILDRFVISVQLGNRVVTSPLEDLGEGVWTFVSRRGPSSGMSLGGRRQLVEADTPPFVSARGADNSMVATWWDNVALTDAEERVTACLRLVTAIERIALVEGPRRSRTVLVKLEARATPEPLRSLGDGLSRMFWIALALENARSSGLLLIDEIENGIHYSVLPDLWNFIRQAAAQYGVQVIATTHSTDCIKAFSGALEQGDDGVLVKLARRRPDDDIAATIFDRSDLTTATQSEIDLR